MSPNRVRLLAVLGCAAGAGLVLMAAGRTWGHVTVVRPAPLPPLHQARTGAALLPWLSPLALATLAGAGALLATRGLVRAAVGVLLVLSGLGLVAGAGTRLSSGASPGWPLVVVVGGLLVAAAGVVTVARGRTWPGMGARYDRPTRGSGGAGTPRTEAQLWDALDRGEDPTR
ncbi:Trp biosynthesis-associated membrane protein [Planosporangium thailandense]|uniref:Trp biosynthesis-associated membrane protein n=1 Tax=Planosporangium thailandense TaxID=765197 RepID=A0ABX0XUZ7_9ACTN|nr:Trp biosynthesis-associated membrane protein [Planosporangium thailandense]NJC69842.1 Trp biosynthesis-associated membrane protein [Planosporangium thailandense]